MSEVQWLGGVEWLGDPPQLTLKYKAILVAWSKAYYGPVFTPKYGDWSGDSTNTWDCFRDGQTLSAFSKWWNNKTGANLDLGTTPDSGMCKNVLTATLTPQHQEALDAFAQPVTVVTQSASGGTPGAVVPGAVVDCSLLCQGTSGWVRAACLAECVKTQAAAEPPPPAGAPKQDALAPAPAPKKTAWGWIILGGAALVGLGYVLLKGAGELGGAMAENPNDWWGPGQRWLEGEARKESASQLAAHLKRGRSRNTFRYSPPDWHRDAMDALGKNDEERFKAIKLGRIGWGPMASNPRGSGEVVPSRLWKHRNGATASPYGAVPWTGALGNRKEDWSKETVGWTIQWSDGTVGIGRQPFKTQAEAQAWLNKENARLAEARARLSSRAENPGTRTREERRGFLYDMAKLDRRDGTDWAARLLDVWRSKQIVSQKEYNDLRHMLEHSR